MPDKTVPYVPAHKSIPTVESSLQSIDEIFNDLQCGLKSAKESKCFICHLDVNKDEEKLQTFHKKCLICRDCKLVFGSDSAFIEYEGGYYCESCHQKKVGLFCSDCNEIILEHALTALNKHWHVNHFKCGECKMPIDLKDNQDYENLFSAKCEKCRLAITGIAVIADEKKYHSECFNCEICLEGLNDSKYFLVKNQRVCAKCCKK